MTESTVAPAARLADRYGRAPTRVRRTRVRALVAGAVVLAAVIAWAIWTGVGGSVSPIDVQTSAFSLHGDRSVGVQWVASGRAGTRLVCAIEAQATDGSVVGLVEVLVPVDGRSDRTGYTVVRTERAATSGLIQSCRDA